MISVIFNGLANSGKTTLINSLCSLLTPKYKVLAIKHDPKGKAQIDSPQKDSGKFFKSGADVALIAPTRSFLHFHKTFDLREIITPFYLEKKYHYVFIEGFFEESIDIPRICVARESLEDRFLKKCCAFAIDSSIPLQLIPKDKAILNLNNPKEVLEWIQSNIKEIAW